jgi:hypothetical protein
MVIGGAGCGAGECDIVVISCSIGVAAPGGAASGRLVAPGRSPSARLAAGFLGCAFFGAPGMTIPGICICAGAGVERLASKTALAANIG